jgi:hypothetical protein
VNDIKTVLRLAKVRAETGTYAADEYARNNAAIEAVETWLREVGALPPERDTTLYGSAAKQNHDRAMLTVARDSFATRKRKRA